jgi:glutamyl-tRNA synthetase
VLDDAVLLKSDGFPTYHLANVVDDHLMAISHVLRGEDWIPSTPLHLRIYRALGWEPPVFAHLPNMLGKDRKKLSKRHGAKWAMEYFEEGYLLEALLNFLTLQGWSPKEERDLYTVEELIEKFTLDGILNSSPIFDPDKLLWYNGQYIRALSLPDLAARTLPFLQEAGLVGTDPDATELSYIGHVLMLEQERMRRLRDAAFAPLDPVTGLPDGLPLADFFFVDDDKLVYDEKAVQKRLATPEAAARLRRVRAGFADLAVFDETNTEGVVRSVAEEEGVKAGEIIHPVRVAVSGRTTGPGLFETLATLGRDRCLRRIDRALAMMGG